MTAVAFGLIGIGALVTFIGFILFLVEAFKEHILWGLGTLFLPFVGLIFLCMHWKVAKGPFFLKLGGIVGVCIGVAVLVFGTGAFKF